MKICFLDSSPIPYTSNDLESKNIRGAENVTIHLSSELSKLNIDEMWYKKNKLLR